MLLFGFFHLATNDYLYDLFIIIEKSKKDTQKMLAAIFVFIVYNLYHNYS